MLEIENAVLSMGACLGLILLLSILYVVFIGQNSLMEMYVMTN